MPHQSDPPRFVVDIMLGRLARWLRLLGYDASYGASWDDRTLARISAREKRTLLTRNHELLRRRIVRDGLLIDADELIDQLRALLVTGRITLDFEGRFSRCPVCNELLKELTREQAWGRVPPYVCRRYERFRRCPECERHFWPGTHHILILARLARIARP